MTNGGVGPGHEEMTFLEVALLLMGLEVSLLGLEMMVRVPFHLETLLSFVWPLRRGVSSRVRTLLDPFCWPAMAKLRQAGKRHEACRVMV